MESTLKPIIQQKLEAVEEAISIILQRCEQFHSINEMLSSVYGSMVFDSCVMRLQTIGENIKSIDDRTNGIYLSQYPSIPWKSIIGLRNIISHEYANIDPEVIWSVISKHLTPLADEVTKMKSELPSK